MSQNPVNISQLISEQTIALQEIYGVKEAKALMNAIIGHYLGWSAVETILNSENFVSADKIRLIETTVDKLKNHYPLQYITGKTYFLDLELYVNTHVLIPRSETEELVRWITDDIKNNNISDDLGIIDIGTGSGCIAITLKKNIGFADVSAVDIDDDILKVAEKNAAFHHVNVHFYKITIINCFILKVKYKKFTQKSRLSE